VITTDKLQCDMEKTCEGAVTHIDNKGFVYCTKCSAKRKSGGTPCRKLTRAETKRLAEGQTISWQSRPAEPEPEVDPLFIGVFSTGLVYADRTVEVHGDYKRLAFLCFATLKLEEQPDIRADLVESIRKHAAKVQARRGEQYVVSGCGQTVLLGDDRHLRPGWATLTVAEREFVKP